MILTHSEKAAAKITANKGLIVASVSVLFAVLIPMTLLSLLSLSKFNGSVAAVASITVFTGIRLGILAARSAPSPLQVTFYIFSYVWLGLTPLLQVSAEEFPWTSVNTQDDILVAVVVVWTGFAAYELGIQLARLRFGRGMTQHAAVSSMRFISTNRLALLSVIATCISVLTVTVSGFWRFLFSPRTTNIGVSSVLELNLLFAFLRMPIMFVTLLAGASSRSASLSKTATKKATALFLFCGLVAFIVCNPICTARLVVGTLLLSVLLVRISWTHRTNLWMAVGLTAAILLAFSSMDMFRASLQPGITDPLDAYLHKGDFDVFQMIVNAVTLCRQSGHTLGRQLTGALLFWFPRALWPSKPVGTGAYIGQALGYKFLNLSCPLWAECFMDFGDIGTFFSFLGYGFVTAKIESAYRRQSSSGSMSLVRVFVPFWTGYQLFFLRGDLLNAVAYSSCFFLCVLFTPLLLQTYASVKLPRSFA